MWRAYLDGKSEAESGKKSSSGVGQHIYIGQYQDDQTSLDYLNARYYDGSRGQFLSEDPVFWSAQNIANPQSLNTYSYALDNPINGSDPSGLFVTSSGLIQKGDTLGAIASQINQTYGTGYTASGLAAANGISNPNRILAGTTLNFARPSAYSQYANGVKVSALNPVQAYNNFTSGNATLSQKVGLGIGVFGLIGSQIGGLADGGTEAEGMALLARLSDDTLVCRGGTCGASEFARGTGVTTQADGTLSGVSVLIGLNGESKEQLLNELPARFKGQGGFTTLGQLKSTSVTFSKTGSPLHFELGGLDANSFAQLFGGLTGQ
jgi:RHS repeat-associated protein